MIAYNLLAVSGRMNPMIAAILCLSVRRLGHERGVAAVSGDHGAMQVTTAPAAVVTETEGAPLLKTILE